MLHATPTTLPSRASPVPSCCSSDHHLPLDFLHHPRSLIGLAEGIAEPVQSLVQTVTGGGASLLDVPCPLTERVEAEFLGNFGGIHSILILISCDWRLRTASATYG